jgi:hypothetical protein
VVGSEQTLYCDSDMKRARGNDDGKYTTTARSAYKEKGAVLPAEEPQIRSPCIQILW